MKYFIDGDQVAVTYDDFTNIQESPIVFFQRESDIGKTIENQGILALPFGDLVTIKGLLAQDAAYNKANQGDGQQPDC